MNALPAFAATALPRMPHSHIRQLIERADKLAAGGKLLEAFELLEAPLLRFPGDAVLIHEVGRFFRSFGLNQEAVKFFIRALELEPANANFMMNLGVTYDRLEIFAEAVDVFRRAIEIDPKDARKWAQLGQSLVQCDDFENARIFLHEALRLDPSFGLAFAMLAELEDLAGNYEASVEWAKKAARRLGDDDNVNLKLSFILLKNGLLKDGYRAYEARHSLSQRDASLYLNDVPRWNGRPVDKKSFLLMTEQGVGDQAMFGSLVNDMIARVQHLTVEVDPRLVALFQRSFPQTRVIASDRRIVRGKSIFFYPWLKTEKRPDVAALFGSTLPFLRPTLESFPAPNAYLKPDPERMAEFRRRLAALNDQPKIGLCWRSHVVTARRGKSYADLRELGPLLHMPGVTFVNLQYRLKPGELAQIREQHGIELVDFADLDQFNDLDGVCALIAALDGVVSVATAVCQFAGALGVPTIGMYQAYPYTALSHKTRIPFQPSVRIAAPDAFADWPVTIARARDLLAEMLPRA
jgi:tetratricopeptide (TPR) repeat protein